MRTYTPRPREQAQEYIEAYIIKNELKAHERLPSERELCARWGVNRSTLRSAIAHMTAEGRLYSTQGSGTRVAPRIIRTMQDLQSFTEYAQARGMKAESRLLNFSCVECDKQLSSRFKRVLGEKLHRMTRLRLLDGVPILMETAFIPVELAPGLDEHDLVHGSLFELLERGYGLTLDHGWEKTGITSTTIYESSYLGIPEGSPAFWIVSETYGRDGTLVEYCRTLARADMLEMRSTLRWMEG